MLIRVKNLLDQNSQVTFLSQTENLGTTTIHVQNTNGPSTQWALQVGKTGEEKSEIVLINTIPSGTSFTLATATVNDHPTDTPVYSVKFDKIIWERSTTGTAGTATAFATTVITPDSLYTQYDDTTGASTYAYKAAFYNSLIPGTSTESDWLTPSGYDFYSLASIRSRVKNKLFSTGFIGDDSIIDEWINEYMEQMTNAAIDVNEDYNLGSTNVSFAGTAELGTISASDFKGIRRVWMTDGVNSYVAQKMTIVDVQPNQVFNLTNPYYFMYDQNVISRWPHDTGGTAAIVYYRTTPVLVNETDTLPVIMRNYTKGFVDYCLAQAKQKEGKPDESTKYEGSAMAQIKQFQKELVPRNKSQQSSIQIVETVGDDASDFMFRI